MASSEIPKIVLDPQNDSEMVAQAKERCRAASNNSISDFRVGSPATAIIEGVVYPVSELLWFLNQLPEAIALEVLRTSGVTRSIGTQARGSAGFLLSAPVASDFFVSQGYQIPYKDSFFVTLEPLLIPAGSIEGLVSVEAVEVGSQYNVPSFGLTQTGQSLTYLQSVFNPEPITGGTDLEPLEETLSRAQVALRSRQVLVSVSDYEEKAQELMGSGSKATCIPLLGSDKQSEATGQVHVFLADAYDQPPSLVTCQSVQSSLRSLSFAGSSVWVSPIEFFSVKVDAVVSVDQISYDQAEAVYNALQYYLKPTQYSLGASLKIKELEHLIRSVVGVSEIVSVLINQQAVNTAMPLPYRTPDLEGLTISLVDNNGFEQTYDLSTKEGDLD